MDDVPLLFRIHSVLLHELYFSCRSQLVGFSLEETEQARLNVMSHLHHLEPLTACESHLRKYIQSILAQHNDRLSESSVLHETTCPLKSIQLRLGAVLTEPIEADSKSAQRQINNMNELRKELLNKLIGGQLKSSEVFTLKKPVEQLNDKYDQLVKSLGNDSDSITSLVNQTEDKFQLLFPPASLIRRRLQQQIRKHRQLMADLKSHQPSTESMKMLSLKSQDAIGRYAQLYDKAFKHGKFLDETIRQLDKFDEKGCNFERKLRRVHDALENCLSNEVTDHVHMSILNGRKDNLRPLYADCEREGKELADKRDVADTGAVRDRVQTLENQWKHLDASITDKVRLSEQRTEYRKAFDDHQNEAIAWLTSIEKRVDYLASEDTVDLLIMNEQIDELKVLAEIHREYGPSIGTVNYVGAQYDLLISSSATNCFPIKHATASELRHLSGSGSASSPSDGNGDGNQRTSQGDFQRSVLSSIQQQLAKINNRHSFVGVRLNDRQNEVESLRKEITGHHENLNTLSNVLDEHLQQVNCRILSRCISNGKRFVFHFCI